MKDRIFIDTNIWLYAFMEQNFEKCKLARNLINENTEQISLSVQVLNEICINLLRKAEYTEEEIKLLIENFNDTYEIYPLTIEDCEKASKIRDRLNISFWDSLIIASAINNGCSILYSEDMQHNQVIEGKLRIINPFKEQQTR